MSQWVVIGPSAFGLNPVKEKLHLLAVSGPSAYGSFRPFADIARHGRESSANLRISAYAGFAPGVPHFAYLPFASRQRVGFCGACLVLHLTNLPFASRQGAAASDGVEAASRPIADSAMMSFFMFPPTSYPWSHFATPPWREHAPDRWAEWL